MHTWPPLISGRHWNMTEGHIISEFTSLYENLCFLACGTINIRAALQGEIFSGENSELGSECEIHAIITLSQSGNRLSGIISCSSVSPYHVPARGLRSQCRAHRSSRRLPTQRDGLTLRAEEVGQMSVGFGSSGPGFELVLLPHAGHLPPPHKSQLPVTCPGPWAGQLPPLHAPRTQHVPGVPLATLHGDCQCLNPPAMGAP